MYLRLKNHGINQIQKIKAAYTQVLRNKKICIVYTSILIKIN